MEKKKGLADTGEGEFILNESGTSVSIDAENENPESNGSQSSSTKEEERKGSSGPEEKDITD